MPRGVKKENLPQKMCVTCNRPFTWRKKWESCWDEVTTCSKSCNHKRREKKQQDKFTLKMKEHGGDEVEKEQLEVAIPTTTDESYGDGNDVQRESEGQETEVKTYDDNLDNLLEELNVFETQELQGATASDNESSYGSNPSPSQMSLEEIQLIKDPKERKKAMRKYEKKLKKQERRAQRQGKGDKSAGQKQCDMCSKSVDLLIRCQYDESLQWKMICGACWNVASGGVVDGDANHPYYKYGGLWKNRRRK